MKLTSIALVAAMLLLSACGSSSDDHHHGSRPPTQPAPPPPVPMVDAFFAFVSSLVNGTEDAEPQAVEQLTPTAPEDSEPAPVGS